MKWLYGVDSMPETGENVASEWHLSREAQDALALASQNKAAAAQTRGRYDVEITPVAVPQRKGDPVIVVRDEHPRATSIESLSALKPVVRSDGTVTPDNASGVNDGAAAMLIASAQAAAQHGLTPRARIVGMAAAGVAPRVMGIGPVDAANRLMARTSVRLDQIDILELNEAFASQAIAVLSGLGIAADDPRVNPNGGAIALGIRSACPARAS